MKGRRLLALSVLAIALACEDSRSPTEPRVLNVPKGPAGAISDGAHGGNPDFFFLPPMVSNPVGHQNYEASRFNATLGPRLTIEICRLQSAPVDANGNPLTTDCATGVALVKKFAAGTVQLQGTATDGHYQVNWNTRESNLDVTKYYRIKVLVEGSTTQLGFADIDPMENKSQVKNARTGEVIALIDDSTLPIKFRVEKSALCNPGESLCTSTIVTNHTPNGEPQIVRIVGADGSAIAGVLIPDGFLPETGPQSVVLTIDRVNTGVNNVAAGTQSIPCHASLPLQQFNSCFHFSTIPELAAINEEGHQFLKALTVAVCFVLHDLEDPREPWVQLWSSDPGAEGGDAKPLPSASSAQILSGASGETCGDDLVAVNENSNRFSRFASAGWQKVKSGFSRVFGVQTAYAVDLGIGGLAFDFSNIGPALTAQIQRYTATGLTLGPGATTTSTARIIGTRVHNGGPLTTGIGGLPVTFTVAAGNGTLRLIGSEAPPATTLISITNTNPINPESPTSGGGFAPVNWTLPTVPGTYTLTAAGAATGGPVTFTATVPPLVGLTALAGSWANENEETGGNPRVRIAVDGSSVTVHAWGACSPTDCDWGPTSADLSRWASNDEITAVWDQGFVISTQTITQLSATRLQIVNHYDFIPPDTRTDFTSPAEFFTKESVVDQSHSLGPANLSANINECCRYVAQTFTAGVTGSLVGVNVEVFTEQTAHPLHVALRTVAGGVPTSTILGERTLTTSGSNLSQLITFPGPIILTAGVQYAIVVSYPSAPPAGGGQGQGSWSGTTTNAYSGGSLFHTFDGVSWFNSGGSGVDAYFRTHMSVSSP